jgi:hypothetical protein
MATTTKLTLKTGNNPKCNLYRVIQKATGMTFKQIEKDLTAPDPTFADTTDKPKFPFGGLGCSVEVEDGVAL